jgi:hypothetical protein
MSKYQTTLEKVIVRLDNEEKEKDRRIVELEKDKINLIEEFAEAECLGEVAKIARQHGYEELKVGIKQ